MERTKIIKKILWVLIVVMVFLIVAFLLGIILGGIKASFEAEKPENGTAAPEAQTEGPAETETPSPEITEAPTEYISPTPEETATPEPITFKDVNLAVVGDVVIYSSMWESAKKYGGGEYDFSEITKYIKDMASAADLAVFNYEGNCAGAEAGYSHYPTFNAPDNIITTMSSSGFDVSLFANNHTYDKGHNGFMRTQQIMKNNGLRTFGTRMSQNGKSYGIYEVNGIKIGILNYTYESGPDEYDNDPSAKFLNGNRLDSADVELVDSFNYARMNDFYVGVGSRISEMKADGADFIIFFIHWGEEYKENANGTQKTIAKNLCNLGVNALIGMHPHVVQPAETFVSDNGANRMICYYSLGNFASAQNRTTFQSKPDYAWLTENEIMATLTLRKYSTGEALVVKAQYEPLWSHRHSMEGRVVTNIVPLNKALVNEETMIAYGLKESSFGVDHAKTAKEYIDGQMSAGIEAFNAGVVLPHEGS
ncbi:MAG: CapA family protein [Clostridia bacterium]|nr:CapA family protein [Clostridia bacterium]